MRDQDGNHIDNISTVGTGPTTSALDESDAQSLEDQAHDLLDELDDPLPDEFDRNLDVEEHYSDTDAEHALVHTQSDWQNRELQNPRVIVPADEPFVVSVWDPEDEKPFYLDDSTTSDWRGSPTSGEVTFKQLSPTGGVTDTHTVETGETTSYYVARDHTDAVQEVRLPAGVYLVEVEGSDAPALPILVGNPDDLARVIEDDLKDEADRLFDRADRVRNMIGNEELYRVSAETNETGHATLEIPQNAEMLQVQAVKADGNIVDPEDPSIEDVRTAHETGYNGSVIMTVNPTRVDPDDVGENEVVEVEAVRLDAPPWSDPERYADKIQGWLEEELDQRLSQVESEFAQRFSEFERDELERQYDRLDSIREANPAVDDRVQEELDGTGIEPGTPADDLTRDELETAVDAHYTAIRDVQHTANVEDTTADIVDDELSYSVEFDAPIDEDAVLVTVEYANGDAEDIPDEYVSVDRSGVIEETTTVSVDDYPLPDDTAVADVSVRVGGADAVGSISEPVVNPAFDGDVPNIRAVDLNTLSPGPDERVSVRLDAEPGTGYSGLVDGEVYAPDGSQIPVDVADDDDRISFKTDGTGVYHVRAIYETQAGDRFVESVRVEADENSRSHSPTIRVEEGPSGQYGVVGETFESARVDSTDDRVSVAGVIEAGDSAPGVVDVHPQSAMDGDTDEIEVRVLEGDDEEAVRSHIGVRLHLTNLDDDSLLWVNGEPITRDGDTRFGKVEERDDGKVVVRTKTDETGVANVEIKHDPNRIERFQHWSAVNGFTIPFLSLTPAPSDAPAPMEISSDLPTTLQAATATPGEIGTAGDELAAAAQGVAA